MNGVLAAEAVWNRPFRASHFRTIAQLMRTIAGVNLTPGKESLVRSRLAPRLRATSVASFDDYLDLVMSDEGTQELSCMIDVLTTNKTSFFREPDHFRYLEEIIFDRLIDLGRPPRIWCAGCSTGEEPYTVAMVAQAVLPTELASRTRVLATDISSRVLTHASAGVYRDELTACIPGRYRPGNIEPGDSGTERMSAATRALIRFARLNLMDEWPMREPFDVIFCRNVMIYFERSTQETLVNRFAARLARDGHLFVGHSESLTGLEHGLKYVQPAVYAR